MIDNTVPSQVFLSTADGSGSISVDHDAYVAFEHRMDEALEQLVARWIDQAAPSARQMEMRLHFGRS